MILFFSQLVSGRYSTNPAILFVPRAASILSIGPAHSGRFFLQPFVRFLKKIRMLFTSQGRSVLGKTVPSVFCTVRGLRPQAVSETSGTVFPNTDLPSGE